MEEIVLLFENCQPNYFRKENKNQTGLTIFKPKKNLTTTYPLNLELCRSLNFGSTLIQYFKCVVFLCFKVLGEIEEFEKAVRLVIKDVSFDNDVVVSVFETNIRVLG